MDKFSPGPCRPTLSRHDWRMISLQRSRSLFAHWYNLNDLAAECPTPGLIPAYRLETLARSVSSNNYWLEIALDELRKLELVEPQEGGALWMTHYPRAVEVVAQTPDEDVAMPRLAKKPDALRQQRRRDKLKKQKEGVTAGRDNPPIVTPSSVTPSVTLGETVTPSSPSQSVTETAKSAETGVTSSDLGVTPSRARQSPEEIIGDDRLIPEEIVESDAGANVTPQIQNVTRNVTAQSVTSAPSTINDSSGKVDKTSFSSSELKPASPGKLAPPSFRADIVQKMVDATKAEHNRSRYEQFFDLANKSGEWQLANQALRQLRKRLEDKEQTKVQNVPAYFDRILVGLIENIDTRFAASRAKQEEIRSDLGLAANATQADVRAAIRASMGFSPEAEGNDAL